MEFKKMVVLFGDLVDDLSRGRSVAIDTELAQPTITIVDGNDFKVIRMVLFHYPRGETRDDLPFVFGTKDDEGFEILPVALPGDAISALTELKNRY